jgi:phosphatidylglycerol lysyltransferase
VPAIRLLIFGAALVTLDHVLREYPAREIVSAWRATPATLVLAAAALSVLGYLALVGYDFVAFRAVGRPLPLGAMLIPSFVSFAVSNTAPASVVAGGGMRYRLYRSRGLTPAQAVGVAGFNVVTYALGICALSGFALLVRPATLGGASTGTSRLLGAFLLVLAALYLTVTGTVRGPVRFFRWTIRLPSLRIALAQLGVSAADWLLSAAALYVLLLGAGSVPGLAFLAAFLVAQAAALLLPVPGGVGVFEAVVLLLLRKGAHAPAVLAALLVYRVVYYLLPLVLAGLLLLAIEIRAGRRQGRPVESLARSAAWFAPRLLSFTTFLSGALLLGSGAIPADERRLAWLSDVLPLTIIEISHFMASVVGAVLILLAWGLERRVRLAYRILRVVFGVGILVTLVRSLDLRVAAFLLGALGILLLSGTAFTQPRSVLREPIGSGWIFAVGAVFLLDLWIGVLSLRHIAFAGETWWRFALFGTAPRALRAAVAVAVAILLFAVARLLARLAPVHPASSAKAHEQ